MIAHVDEGDVGGSKSEFIASAEHRKRYRNVKITGANHATLEPHLKL